MIASTRDVITSPPPPTPAELRRIAAGDQQACRNLIDRWESPIKIIASGFASRASDIDDLMQIGRLAVHQSALNYDLSLEFPFGNYAKRGIKNCIMQEATRLARQRRLETPLEGHAEDGDDLPPEMVNDTGPADAVKGWVLELPEPHATIFRLLYVEKLKQRGAAEELGISQPRVAQLHRSFLDITRAAFTA
jgi:RNA polymerase sigma factor (sigma-70 family)